MPKDAASRPRTRVAMRSRSATRSSEVSIASSVPAASTATVTPCGAAARTRSMSPSPYATGVAPSSRMRSNRRSDDVATTVAPHRRANWIAAWPTDPEPPCTSRVSAGPTASERST